MKHDLIRTGDADSFRQIEDPNGEVVLSYCRRCRMGEGELEKECGGEFEMELRQLINKHSKENESDTPDYILAGYLLNCLDAFTRATQRRDDYKY